MSCLFYVIVARKQLTLNAWDYIVSVDSRNIGFGSLCILFQMLDAFTLLTFCIISTFFFPFLHLQIHFLCLISISISIQSVVIWHWRLSHHIQPRLSHIFRCPKSHRNRLKMSPMMREAHFQQQINRVPLTQKPLNLLFP